MNRKNREEMLKRIWNLFKKQTGENKHYVTLLNGKRVRVVYNMSVFEELVRIVGKEQYKRLASGKITDLASWKIIYFIMVREGEAADGRQFKLTADELWKLVSFSHAKEFASIINSESEVIAGVKMATSKHNFSTNYMPVGNRYDPNSLLSSKPKYYS